MCKKIFVLPLTLLFLLTACSTEEPLSNDSDSESSIFIVSPTEDEAVSDPTEANEGNRRES